MELVCDTNIVFSLFKKDSFTRKLIKEHKLILFSPDWLIKELDKYKSIICSKSKIPLEFFNEAKESILKLVTIKNPSKNSFLKASKLISDKLDIPFLALAIELDIPIWSNDTHFKEQLVTKSIKVFTTKELNEFVEDYQN